MQDPNLPAGCTQATIDGPRDPIEGMSAQEKFDVLPGDVQERIRASFAQHALESIDPDEWLSIWNDAVSLADWRTMFERHNWNRWLAQNIDEYADAVRGAVVQKGWE